VNNQIFLDGSANRVVYLLSCVRQAGTPERRPLPMMTSYVLDMAYGLDPSLSPTKYTPTLHLVQSVVDLL